MNARCAGIASEHAASADPAFEPLASSIRAITDMLRSCVDAAVCLIAIERSDWQRKQLYGTCDLASGTGGRASEQAAQTLLDLPAEPVIFNGPPVRGAVTDRTAAALAALAQMMQVNSFICLPLRVSAIKARMCIATEQGGFTPEDLRNLTPIAEQVSTLMECIYSGERLAMDFARHERRHISRDLHDSAIQPFIGLKLGLEALRRRLAEKNHLVKDVEELIAIAGAGIGDLRQYVGALRAVSASRTAEGLASAVRCQAKKFSALYGIEATVVASGNPSISARMQHEVIQIIREGLSNIRRHTTADRATIHIRQQDGRLLLDITNNYGAQTPPWRGFSPRSIRERAKELGGRVRVNRRNGYTVIAVELPLQ